MSDKKRDKTTASDENPDPAEDTVFEIETPEAQAPEKNAELEKAKSDLLYLGAEFENYKKHAIRERSEAIKYGAERLARDLLDVIDNFERALSLDVTPENLAAFREGISMTHKNFLATLHKNGIQEVNPVGQPFDPSTQEALTSEESDQVEPGTVSRVFRNGYRLHDRLLRAAQVVVAKAPAEKKE